MFASSSPLLGFGHLMGLCFRIVVDSRSIVYTFHDDLVVKNWVVMP